MSEYIFKHMSDYDKKRLSILLNELFPEGYTVNDFKFVAGDSYDFDGIKALRKSR